MQQKSLNNDCELQRIYFNEGEAKYRRFESTRSASQAECTQAQVTVIQY